MSVLAGTRIGRYEINELLGVGGMGEVYRAFDTELHRAVAFKFLRAEVASDEKWMQRFIREARAASTLNHPNILTVYEIGQAGDGARFFVSEFIDGSTLRVALTLRQMKLVTMLDVLIQVAGALAAAHATGVIHRDIKPENIMIRKDGYVKVLDFGLAKLTGKATPAADTEAATLALVNTDPGTVMGTVNYMSPEQARGLETDARTDLWSLGAVLYEMIAGQLPFAGVTPTDTILAIVDKEPLPLSHHIREVPEALEWIVTKALTKDKDERYQTASDMLVDLRQLKQRADGSAELKRSVAPDLLRSSSVVGSGGASGLSRSNQPTVTDVESNAALSGEVSPRPTMVPGAEHAVGRAKGNKALAAAVALSVLILASVIIFVVFKLTWRSAPLEGRAQDRTAQSFTAMKVTRLTTNGKNGNATISPDGKVIVHEIFTDDGRSSLWVRQVSSNSSVQIVPPAEGDFSGTTFTPDGEHIYYVRTDHQNPYGALFEVATFGGTPRPLRTDISSPVSFSPDGQRIAFVNNFNELVTTDVVGANAQTLATLDAKLERFSLAGPSWSPDGSEIAIGKLSTVGGSSGATVVAVPASGGAPRTLTRQNWSNVWRVVWLHDNSGLVFTASSNEASGTQIWYLPLPEGPARRVTNDLNSYGEYSLGVTADGTTLVTLLTEDYVRVWIASPGDDESRARPITTGRYDGFGGLAWTPDGQIIFGRKVGDLPNIWMMNTDSSQIKQLTNDAAVESTYSVTPDGRYIVFSSDRSGMNHIWRMNLDGSDQKQLTDGGIEDYNPHLSPDGSWVVFNSNRTGRDAPWRVGIDGGEPALLLDHSAHVEGVSPDGQWVACNYADKRGVRVALIPFGGGEPVKFFDHLPPSTEGRKIAWAADGRALVYADKKSGADNIWLLPLDGSTTRKLTNFKTDRILYIAPASDGKRFAVSRVNSTLDVVLFKDFR
jgi:serine/threonine protein kinase/Tol biopolymer transport system component